jgi:nicotinamidase-related amidase/Sec-independent protein translocase protein TatA
LYREALPRAVRTIGKLVQAFRVVRDDDDEEHDNTNDDDEDEEEDPQAESDNLNITDEDTETQTNGTTPVQQRHVSRATSASTSSSYMGGVGGGSSIGCGGISTGCEVIFTYLQSTTKDNRDISLDYQLSGPLLAQIPNVTTSMEDLFLPELMPSIHAGKGDILLPKTSCSVFQSTNLDYILRQLQVEQLVVVGQLTNQCVESAVRDAADLGYFVTVVDDACAARSPPEHWQGLANMKGFARIVPSAQVLTEIVEDLAMRLDRSEHLSKHRSNQDNSPAAPAIDDDVVLEYLRNNGMREAAKQLEVLFSKKKKIEGITWSRHEVPTSSTILSPVPLTASSSTSTPPTNNQLVSPSNTNSAKSTATGRSLTTGASSSRTVDSHKSFTQSPPPIPPPPPFSKKSSVSTGIANDEVIQSTDNSKITTTWSRGGSRVMPATQRDSPSGGSGKQASI